VAQTLSRTIEIDYIDLRGPAFESWDQRTLLAHLVSADLPTSYFPVQGPGCSPTEALYKKPSCSHPDTLATSIPRTRRFTRDCCFRYSANSE